MQPSLVNLFNLAVISRELMLGLCLSCDEVGQSICGFLLLGRNLYVSRGSPHFPPPLSISACSHSTNYTRGSMSAKADIIPVHCSGCMLPCPAQIAPGASNNDMLRSACWQLFLVIVYRRQCIYADMHWQQLFSSQCTEFDCSQHRSSAYQSLHAGTKAFNSLLVAAVGAFRLG